MCDEDNHGIMHSRASTPLPNTTLKIEVDLKVPWRLSCQSQLCLELLPALLLELDEPSSSCVSLDSVLCIWFKSQSSEQMERVSVAMHIETELSVLIIIM